MQDDESSKILVIGACALDRLLYVPCYPKEDAKILCHETFECGGGNAANTASGLGRLSNAAILNHPLKIQLLTKLGDDTIKDQLCQELLDFSVDISTTLFLHGSKGTSSPVATVVVSTCEPYSRTCLFDKGTCGVLESSDIKNCISNFDEILSNVTLLHSDTRHTDAAALLAKEAYMRGIPVSLDLERDRFSSSFDEIINYASVIFTSGDAQIKSIMERRMRDDDGRGSLLIKANDVQLENESIRKRFGFFIETVCIFHALMAMTQNRELEWIMTRGHYGALHCHVKEYSDSKQRVETTKIIKKEYKMDIEYSEEKDTLLIHLVIEDILEGHEIGNNEKICFHIHLIGPPCLNTNVKDSTGAGDAFCAGYLWSKILLESLDNQPIPFDEKQFQLRMASWVAGKKLLGRGARTNLPTSSEVDIELGTDIESIVKSLSDRVEKYCL